MQMTIYILTDSSGLRRQDESHW